jgi:hypothetical protein
MSTRTYVTIQRMVYGSMWSDVEVCGPHTYVELRGGMWSRHST